MAADAQLIAQVTQANMALQEGIDSLHFTRNKLIDAVVTLSLIGSGNLANAVAAIRVGMREIEGQLLQFEIASREIQAYRERIG